MGRNDEEKRKKERKKEKKNRQHGKGNKIVPNSIQRHAVQENEGERKKKCKPITLQRKIFGTIFVRTSSQTR